LAYQGIDSRDLYRPGSGLTLRRLYVLLMALPPTAPLWVELAEEKAKAEKPTAEKIRDRKAAFEARNAAQLAKEEVS
jgi:hypothetical protein